MKKKNVEKKNARREIPMSIRAYIYVSYGFLPRSLLSRQNMKMFPPGVCQTDDILYAAKQYIYIGTI